MKPLVFLAFWFLPVAAYSQTPVYFETGNSLAENLNSDKFLAKAVALGYVSGVVDSLENFQYVVGRADDMDQQVKDFGKGKPRSDPSHFYHSLHICLPDRATTPQMTKVVQKYFNEHPEKLSEPAAALVEEAIKEAFPCSRD